MANPALSSLSFIIGAIFDLYALVVALRFVMQAVGAGAQGPISEFILRATNPLVLPLERLIPRFRQFNLAALVLCFLILSLKALIFKALSQVGYVGAFPFQLPSMGLIGLLWYAFVSVISLIFNIFIFSIIILALLSWISPDPRSPIYEILNPITYPVLSRVRKFVPPLGGLDLSALAAIIGLYALKIFVVGVLVSLA